MRFPSREQVERIKREYPAGCKVRLVHMDDPQSPPVGTIGEVMGCDDSGSLLVRWSNGSGLKRKSRADMDKKIRDEILDIRSTGLANMLDIPYVQRLAFDRNYFDLVLFIEEHRKEYVHFILYGDDDEKV